MTDKFNPKVYQGKKRIYVAVPRAPRVSRLWIGIRNGMSIDRRLVANVILPGATKKVQANGNTSSLKALTRRESGRPTANTSHR